MAPPYEPPRQRPWIIRKPNRMNAAARPIDSNVGINPIAPVPRAMPTSVMMKVYFAADAVTQPAEQERPQRTDQEPGGEQRDRAEQRRDRVALFEEFER